MPIKNSLVLIVLLALSSCGQRKYHEGERIYAAYCENCHMEDGQGLAKLIPPLTDQQYLSDNRDLLPCIIRHGINGPIEVNNVIYNDSMAGADLKPVQIHNLINYVNNSWGNKLGYTTIEAVEKALENCNVD